MTHTRKRLSEIKQCYSSYGIACTDRTECIDINYLLNSLEIALDALREIKGFCPHTDNNCNIAECSVSKKALQKIDELSKQNEWKE